MLLVNHAVGRLAAVNQTPENRREYRLLIFDWDGTLLDSIGSILACTRVTLEELGLPSVPDERIRGVIGLGLRETVEVLAPGCEEELFQAILDVYRRHWIETWRHKPILFPGVRELLEDLARQGYLLAVATAKARTGLDMDLAATGLAERFDATRTISEARSKPNPEMVLSLTYELGISTRETLVIGDTSHDLEMAHNAGAAAIGVCSGCQTRASLERCRPLACLDFAVELDDWLSAMARTTVDTPALS